MRNAIHKITKDIRGKKYERLQEVEKLVCEGVHTYRAKVLEIKQSLRKEEEITCQHLQMFFRESWALKADRPCKEMFKLLKKKWPSI